MSRQLLIHIGHYKTGTTALQVFCERNQGRLRRAGLAYGQGLRRLSKHSAYAFSILRAAGVERLMHGYARPEPPAALWQDLYREVLEGPAPATLISSEEFIRVGEFPRAARILAELVAGRPAGVEIRAIVYLRAPGPHLWSWYNQLVKLGEPLPDFETALADPARGFETIHYDYRRALAPWVETLGPGGVILRPYLKAPGDPGALPRDFLAALGIDLPGPPPRPEADPNPRLDDRMVELLRLARNAGLPGPAQGTIRSAAEAYLARQDAVAGDAPGETPAPGAALAAARAAAVAGLDWLDGLPGGGLPGDFARDLPAPRPGQAAETALMLGFLLQELVRLRQRVRQLESGDLDSRIAALERRLAERARQE